MNDRSVPRPELWAECPCSWARTRLEEASRGIPERRTEAELTEALSEEEIHLGRVLSRREVLAFALGFLAPSYSRALRPLRRVA